MASTSQTRGDQTPEEVVVEGASPNEQLLAAAKTDNEELVLSALGLDENGEPDPSVHGTSDRINIADINHQDGLGNSALHYAIMHASISVLEHLLCAEGCDVDLQNKIMRDTPLHLAVKVDEEGRWGLRAFLVQSLTEAGANPFIKDKHSLRPIDLLPPPPPPTRPGSTPLARSEEEQAEQDSIEQVRALLRQSEAEAMMETGEGEGEARGGDVADADDFIDANDVASDDE